MAEFLSGSARSATLASASLVALLDDHRRPRAAAFVRTTGPRGSSTWSWRYRDAIPDGAPPRSPGSATRSATTARASIRCSCAGYNLLALGNAEEALPCFATVTEQRPDDLFAWEGARSAAEALEDAAGQAVACARSARFAPTMHGPQSSGKRRASSTSTTSATRARRELCFEKRIRARRNEGVAFDRLFRRVRERGESDKLLGLIERRIDVADDPSEIGKLFWERARILRKKGDLAGRSGGARQRHDRSSPTTSVRSR